MALVTRLYDFTPGTLIQSAQVDDEFNQLVGILNGSFTDINVEIGFDGLNAPLTVRQYDALGTILFLLENNNTRFQFTAAGTLDIPTAAIAPITVSASSLVCTNLNADKVDGIHGTSFLRNDVAGQIAIDNFIVSGANPILELRDTTGGAPDFTFDLNAGVLQCLFVGGSSLMNFDQSNNRVIVSTLVYGRPVFALTSGITLAASQSGAVVTNEGATARLDMVLPSAAPGYHFTFIVQDTDAIRVTASSGDNIRIGSSVSATAGRIDANTIGAAITLVAINATQWIATNVVETWSVT